MRAEVEKITGAIGKIVAESNSRGAVVALSGGVDSAVVLKLSILSGADTYALMMPETGVSHERDLADAREFAEGLGAEYSVIEINRVFDSVRDSFPWHRFGVGNRDMSEANIKPRIRMLYTYLVANLDNRIVLGTTNKSELLLGYVTKFGDGAADIEPISDLYKTEVFKLAGYLRLPEEVICKKPSAGLWRGQTDEGELGAGYRVLDRVLKHLFDDKYSVEETADKLSLDKKLVDGINNRMEVNKHKREPIGVVKFI